MKLTERDIDILNFINDFGFCEMSHLNQRFGFHKPRNYQVIERLVKAHYLKHERIFYKRAGIFRLTPKGANLTSLPPLKKIILGNYNHDLTVINLALKLCALHPESVWFSERRLKWEKFRTGIGKRGHLADGLLLMPDRKPIAIEVELHLKGKLRIERILKDYGSNFDIHEVWYYCATKVLPVVQTLAAKRPFVKIFSIADFLA